MEQAHGVDSHCDMMTEAVGLDTDLVDVELLAKWPAVGDWFGEYKLLKVLGTGGAGRVYRARSQRPEDMGRQVAIKVSRRAEEHAVPCQVDLIMESQRASSLRHPNIVDVYRVGKQGSYTYSMMEWVDGLTLSQLLKRKGPLSISFCIDVGIQICDALSYMHGDLGHGPRESLIHCDLKPANIMIDRFGRVKLIDFGVCRRINEAMPKDKVVYGTPAYMAPEQIMRHELTRGTDVFSLGTVLYEMATGARLFPHKNIKALLAHRMELWETERAWSRYPRQLTGCRIFDRVLSKCTEPLVVKRFGKAEQLSRSLTLLQQHRSVQRNWLG